jgi:hypothetical protein
MARFVAPEALAIVNIGAMGITQDTTSSDPICVGILDNTLTCVATSGNVTGKLNFGASAIQIKVALTATYTLTSGSIYYAAIVGTAASWGGGTPQVAQATFSANNAMGGMWGTGAGVADLLFKNSVSSALTVSTSYSSSAAAISPGMALQLCTT